ncbi:MAG: beta-galactosidase, partial [Lentisphaeria bacterium]
ALLFDHLDLLGEKHNSVTPESMEYWGQSFGFIHYRTKLSGPVNNMKLGLDHVHDRALIFLDGEYFATYYRNDESDEFDITIPRSGMQLDILVENMGRINYGTEVGRDFKGILGGVRICLQYQYNWETWTLPLDHIETLVYGGFNPKKNQPAFHRGVLEVDEVADTFLVLPGKKGNVWVNGFNVGRYWEAGPQKTLYIPSSLLKKGKNEIVVFELHELCGNHLKFATAPDLG